MTDDRAASLKRQFSRQETSRSDIIKTQSIKKEDSSDTKISKLREKLQADQCSHQQTREQQDS